MRSPRPILIALTVMLAVHVWMLAGHGHDCRSAVTGERHVGAMAWMTAVDSSDGAAPSCANIGMELTCLVVLVGALLLLGRRRIAATLTRSIPRPVSRVGGQPQPRSRSPVELCISRM
jgi:hypothetical protein